MSEPHIASAQAASPRAAPLRGSAVGGDRGPLAGNQAGAVADAPGGRSVEASGEAAAVRAALLLPPLNAVLELALFVVVVLAIDAFWPSFALTHFEPNPSWLPVLLLSVQYGTVSGLLAAAACIMLSIQTGFPEQDVGENLFVYLLRAWAQPMLWIGAAVVLGQFRTRHIAERMELNQQLATLSAQRTALARHATALRARCDALERHLAGRDGNEAGALLARLAEIGTGDDIELVSGFRALIATALPGASASLLLIGEDGLKLMASTVPEAGQPSAGSDSPLAEGATFEVGPVAGLLRELEQRRAVVSVLTAEGERLLDGVALVAVPIDVGGAVGAMIMIHGVDPQALTPTLMAGLPVVAAALAPAIEASLAGPGTEAGQAVGVALAARAPAGDASQSWFRRVYARATGAAAEPVTAPPRQRVR